MKQLSFAASEFAKKPKQMRREKFLLEMDAVVPWSRLLSVIAPHHPKAGNGRRPYELPTMLRIHFMQQWFGYADAAMEEALHEVPLLRHFAGLDAGTDTMPDETTILNFRHLLEKHALSSVLFEQEYGATLHSVCAGQFVSGQTGVARVRGIVRTENGELPRNRAIPGQNGLF